MSEHLFFMACRNEPTLIFFSFGRQGYTDIKQVNSMWFGFPLLNFVAEAGAALQNLFKRGGNLD